MWHVFHGIDGLKFSFLCHVREARMMCHKTVDIFTLLSHSQDTGDRPVGMTQTPWVQLERVYGFGHILLSFLNHLQALAVNKGRPSGRRTKGDSEGAPTPATSTSAPPSQPPDPELGSPIKAGAVCFFAKCGIEETIFVVKEEGSYSNVVCSGRSKARKITTRICEGLRRHRNSSEIICMSSSVVVDRKLSATARLGQWSTMVESASGRVVQTSEVTQSHRIDKTMQQNQHEQQTPVLSSTPTTPTIGQPQQWTGPGWTSLLGRGMRNGAILCMAESMMDRSRPLGRLALRTTVPRSRIITPMSTLLTSTCLHLLYRKMLESASLGITSKQGSSVGHNLAREAEPLIAELGWGKVFKGVVDKKSKVTKKGSVFGIRLEQLVKQQEGDSILGIRRERLGMSVEGILLKNGKIRGLKEVTDGIDRDAQSVNLTQDNGLAGLLKNLLRDVPEPLLTSRLH
ncbi:hypothetical protein BU17DRAFT_87561 [Hysterangium stoloniferum]|nr:hypothetical protein BU17DRAFT_87561 [Hysterangium stoloniferum]